jgi:hypothetical protein
VRHRVRPDVLLRVTVLFWSFNLTVVGFTYRPFRKALLIAAFQRIA